MLDLTMLGMRPLSSRPVQSDSARVSQLHCSHDFSCFHFTTFHSKTPALSKNGQGCCRVQPIIVMLSETKHLDCTGAACSQSSRLFAALRVTIRATIPRLCSSPAKTVVYRWFRNWTRLESPVEWLAPSTRHKRSGQGDCTSGLCKSASGETDLPRPDLAFEGTESEASCQKLEQCKTLQQGVL